MYIGKIDDGYRLTHNITEKLLELAKKHPDYPIVVLVGNEASFDDYCWTYASLVSVSIEEILDCNTEWWYEGEVCNDRDEFEERVCDSIYYKLKEELGRIPTDEEQDEAWEKVKEAHEPYWKKVIAIKADN